MYRRYLWLSTLACFSVRQHVNRNVLCQVAQTCLNRSNSSSTVNKYYYCYRCCVYTSSCAWSWVHVVRQSLFNAAWLCKWKHHTLPKCSRLNAGVWRTLFAWLSPGCREKKNTLSPITHSLLLCARIICHPALLVSENGHLTQTHTVGHLCCSRPPADLFKCLPLSQQWVGLTSKRSKPVGQYTSNLPFTAKGCCCLYWYIILTISAATKNNFHYQ